MNLENVIGFGRAKEKLEQLDIANLRTCLIFYGKEHCGKFTLAKAIADELTSVQENIHVVNLQDKKTQISIEQIRQMLDDIKLQPYNGDKRRIVIIDDAQTLNGVSENAILKLLEEPPPHVMVILIVNELSRLLPTIRSRCYAIQMSHDQDEVDQVYSDSGQSKAIKEFVKSAYNEQIGVILKLDQSPDYLETIKAQEAIIKMLPTVTTRQSLMQALDLFSKVNIKETLLLAMMYYSKPENKPTNPEVLHIIHDALTDANRNLNDKLIVDSLIGKLASSNKVLPKK